MRWSVPFLTLFSLYRQTHNDLISVDAAVKYFNLKPLKNCDTHINAAVILMYYNSKTLTGTIVLYSKYYHFKNCHCILLIIILMLLNAGLTCSGVFSVCCYYFHGSKGSEHFYNVHTYGSTNWMAIIWACSEQTIRKSGAASANHYSQSTHPATGRSRMLLNI